MTFMQNMAMSALAIAFFSYCALFYIAVKLDSEVELREFTMDNGVTCIASNKGGVTCGWVSQ